MMTLKTAVIGLGLLTAASAHAAPILDANYSGSGNPQFPFSINAANPILAETFTAQRSGQLTSYGLYALPVMSGSPSSLSIALTTTVAGGPAGGRVLSQSNLSSATVTSAGFYTFDISPAKVSVVAGEQYALVAYATAANPAIAIGGDSPGSYAGGATYFGQPSSLRISTTTDLFFQTFVDAAAAPTSVPEPATVALFATGLLGLGLLRRGQG